MTTVVKSTSNSLVSLLSIVDETANATVQTVRTMTKGIDMLDRAVERARQDQIENHMLEATSRRRNRILEVATETEETEYRMEVKYGASPTAADRAQRFNTIVAELEALFTETQP